MSTQASILLQLRKETAEFRMRRGDACADIARELGVSQSTLAAWAAEGRWRKKDIAFERSEERGQALLADLAKLKAGEHEEAERRAAQARELGEAAMKAMQAADPKGEGAPLGMKPNTRQLALSMAHALLEQGRLDEADRAARFAFRIAQAQKMMNEAEEARWRDDRWRIMDWWKKNREGFIAFHTHANEAIDELRANIRRERLHLEEGMCPACSRPADFWPAEMHDVRTRAVERIEDRRLAELAEEGVEEDVPDPIDKPGARFW